MAYKVLLMGKSWNFNCVYLQGVFWFILSLVVSVSNDVIAKKAGVELPAIQIVFLRFFFGVLTLLPLMIYLTARGKNQFSTTRPLLHIIRGALLFVGITLWCYGLNIVPLAMATTLNFTIPMFTLVLAILFLKEEASVVRWVATIAGFFGVFVLMDPTGESFEVSSLILLVSAFLFASLDILNKKFVIKETMSSMLFYSALVTMLLSAPFAIYSWHPVMLADLGELLILGIGGNLILYLLLKAFSLVDASALTPFRYLELVFSTVVGYYYFGEVLDSYFWIGATIIVLSSFLVVYLESKQRKSTKQKVKE